jgi:hypothetical protein
MSADRDLRAVLQRQEETRRERLRGGLSSEDVDFKKIRERRQQQPEEPETPLPDIDELLWYIHCLLVAASQTGKTNVLRYRIVQLLERIVTGKDTLILMEPKGTLIGDLLHLQQVWEMRDRLVIIDPNHTCVSLNLFDTGDESSAEATYRLLRILRTVTTGLTTFQRDTLTFAIMAMYESGSKRNIKRLADILRKGKEALDLSTLSAETHDFFALDYEDSQGKYVVARLNGLLTNPVFRALFSADHATFNMHQKMEAGSLIVINCGARSLGGMSTLFGRVWIEEVCRCMWPRFAMLERGERITPTTFIIDEAQRYIKDDEHVAEILDTAAEAKISLINAVHHMGQITNDEVRHSLYTNSSIKLSANTTADVHNLARSMGKTDHKMIEGLPRYHFAFYQRGMSQAEVVKFPLTDFKKMDRISATQAQEMIKDNRVKYSYVPPTEEPTVTPVAAASQAASTMNTAKRRDARRYPPQVKNKRGSHPSVIENDRPAGSEGSNEW